VRPVASTAPAEPDRQAGPALPPRRRTGLITSPRRAEDVLGGGQPQGGDGSRWWSRSAPPAAATRPAPVPRTPVTAGTSGAGLPMRVPMAQLPGTDVAPPPAPPEEETVPVPAGLPPRPYAEPDPERVGSTLSRFYSGVHRAAHERIDEPRSPA
jgi:hypothetical protein